MTSGPKHPLKVSSGPNVGCKSVLRASTEHIWHVELLGKCLKVLPETLCPEAKSNPKCWYLCQCYGWPGGSKQPKVERFKWIGSCLQPIQASTLQAALLKKIPSLRAPERLIYLCRAEYCWDARRSLIDNCRRLCARPPIQKETRFGKVLG